MRNLLESSSISWIPSIHNYLSSAVWLTCPRKLGTFSSPNFFIISAPKWIQSLLSWAIASMLATISPTTERPQDYDVSNRLPAIRWAIILCIYHFIINYMYITFIFILILHWAHTSIIFITNIIYYLKIFVFNSIFF